jgi:pimeloyl-ACP methyl ester carboxylesterase
LLQSGHLGRRLHASKRVLAALGGLLVAIPLVLTTFFLTARARGCGVLCTCLRARAADAAPPAQTQDPRFGEHKFVTVNGVRLHYVERGDPALPLLLCLHGFPESWWSWRWFLRAFAATHHVVAVDQRGYGLTSRPDKVEDYDMEHLAADLVGLLDHLGIEKAVFCGHDWGGFVVWQMALMHPDRVAGVIGLNTPFTPRGDYDPIASMRFAFGEDMYIVWFQKPGEADAALGKDVDKTMRFFMRRPPEDMPAPPSGGLSIDRNSSPATTSTFAFRDMLAEWDKSDTANQLLNPDELAAFVETFEASGFTGGINWYRNFTRNWIQSEKIDHRVTQPSLMVMAEKDAVLPPSSADGMEAIIADLEKVLIKDSGHWTQQEKPEEVNRILLDWLGRRFPQPA